MNAARDTDPVPVSDLTHSDAPGEAVVPVEPEPSLADLSPEASGRIVRYIVTNTLEHGVAPSAVVALYADLGGGELAGRYADRRFILRGMPFDRREMENRVVDLDRSARERGAHRGTSGQR